MFPTSNGTTQSTRRDTVVYYMGRPVCRGRSLPSAVHEAAYLTPPPAATPPATAPLSLSKPRRPPPATLSGASEKHPEPAPRPKPRIPFAAVLGAVFGVASLGVLAGIVLAGIAEDRRMRNGGRKSRNLQLSQCDDPPDAAPARRAPSQAPITLRVLDITKRGGRQERARLTGAAASDAPDEPPPYPGPDPPYPKPDEP